jgi:hypothetical protein
MSLYENYSNKTGSHSDGNALSDFVHMHSNGVHVSVRRLSSSLSFYHREQNKMFPKGYAQLKCGFLSLLWADEQRRKMSKTTPGGKDTE